MFETCVDWRKIMGPAYLKTAAALPKPTLQRDPGKQDQSCVAIRAEERERPGWARAFDLRRLPSKMR